MKPVKVLVFPKGSNPYQDALYAELANGGQYSFDYIVLSPIVFLTLPWIFIAKRLTGCKIFHLHWLAFSFQKKFLLSRVISFGYSFFCLFIIKACGYKLVWTVHNLLPHEIQTSNDKLIGRYLSQIANYKIIHSKSVIQQMKNLNYNIKNLKVIPHGSYLNLYKNSVNSDQARRKFGLAKTDFVILFFGAIRPYKGLEELLVEFEHLSKPAKLLIGGKCDDANIASLIANHPLSKQIIFYDNYIADDDIQFFFNACNVVCLPFRSITTSGSALLALSFAKPIVAPLIGSLVDLPNEVGFLYQPGNLKSALSAALEDNLDDKSKAALAYAKSLAWDKIAIKTAAVYADLD